MSRESGAAAAIDDERPATGNRKLSPEQEWLVNRLLDNMANGYNDNFTDLAIQMNTLFNTVKTRSAISGMIFRLKKVLIGRGYKFPGSKGKLYLAQIGEVADGAPKKMNGKASPKRRVSLQLPFQEPRVKKKLPHFDNTDLQEFTEAGLDLREGAFHIARFFDDVKNRNRTRDICKRFGMDITRWTELDMEARQTFALKIAKMWLEREAPIVESGNPDILSVQGCRYCVGKNVEGVSVFCDAPRVPRKYSVYDKDALSSWCAEHYELCMIQPKPMKAGFTNSSTDRKRRRGPAPL